MGVAVGAVGFRLESSDEMLNSLVGTPVARPLHDIKSQAFYSVSWLLTPITMLNRSKKKTS